MGEGEGHYFCFAVEKAILTRTGLIYSFEYFEAVRIDGCRKTEEEASSVPTIR